LVGGAAHDASSIASNTADEPESARWSALCCNAGNEKWFVMLYTVCALEHTVPEFGPAVEK
jgi:hypothetical protein